MDITASQQMFMLFFSILYGIMLNSLIGLGAFPITSALACEDAYKDKGNGNVKWKKGFISTKRFLVSFILFNISPFVYFALLLKFIGDNVGLSPVSNWLSLQFFSSFLAPILFVALSSLAIFAFYYFFFGLVVSTRIRLYTPHELNKIKIDRIIHRNSWTNFTAGLLWISIVVLMSIAVYLT